MSYQDFKTQFPTGTQIVSVQGIANPYGVQCVNVPRAYAALIWPDVPFSQTISSGDARTLFINASPQYFDKFPNNPTDSSQLPQPGDVMIFDATPKAGYTNQFANPDGHVGLCDSASEKGYYLLQENAPREGQGINITLYAWDYRPCIGWLRPKIGDNMVYVPDDVYKDLVNWKSAATAPGKIIIDKTVLDDAENWKNAAITQFLPQIQELKTEVADNSKAQQILSDMQATINKYKS